VSAPQFNFDWDARKAKQNLRKHGVSFAAAAAVFRDPLAVSIFDEEHSRDEERWITIGRGILDTVLVVVHTFGDTGPGEVSIRIISVRPATSRERNSYEERP
jgi:uncharacterized protein